MDLWPPFSKKRRSKRVLEETKKRVEETKKRVEETKKKDEETKNRVEKMKKKVADRISEMPDSLCPPKKRRSYRFEDRISELPESLLVQILSLLPTKDAFTTCVLSKRWQYLWPSIDHFFFCCKDILQRRNFICFVDYVLAHSACSKIRKFHLDFTHLSVYEERIGYIDRKFLIRRWIPTDFEKNENELLFPICRWLATAVKKNVENVVLRSDLFSDDNIYLPHSIYKCSSLITLDLTCCRFDKEIVIDWKSLQSLKLKYITLDDDDIVNLLSGCPALETLEFSMFHGFSRLEINSSNLKRLKIEDSWPSYDEDDPSLDIFAPHIQHLEISEDVYVLKCRLVNVSSMVSAKLTFRMSCSWFAQGISSDTCPDEHQVIRTLVEDCLQKLSNATELTIGTWFIEVPLQFEELTLPELKCKCLTLDLHITEFHFYGAATLMRATPHVETLNINMAATFVDLQQWAFDLGYLAKEHDIHFLSSFEFPNLKNVNIVSSSKMCFKEYLLRDYDDIFKLSEFLLKNATVLEKFIIRSRRRNCEFCSLKDCASRYSFRLAEKLVGCPRSSTDCVIIFQEGAFHD